MKTFKEWIDEIIIHYSETSFPVPPYQILGLIEEFKIFYKNEISNAIKNEQMTFDWLRDIIAKKDKEINFFKQQLELAYNLNKNLETKQLYKEDFTEFYVCEQHAINLDNCKCNIIWYWNNTNDNFRIKWLLKDNSEYDKLESKEEEE
ncbi:MULTISPECIES: hypothetical protein [unclassified Spiroplasma]|uniref:hypothetical protein n=1 Tax=unclassified Spiroplasma TaxID=2637901 RepID=UPI0030CF5089